MKADERKRLLGIIEAISKSPDMGYFIDKGFPSGLVGCSVISAHLNELAIKIYGKGTPEQLKKLKDLSDAYGKICDDLNESYLLYLMYERVKRSWREEKERNKYLIEENEKLKKSINFE